MSKENETIARALELYRLKAYDSVNGPLYERATEAEAVIEAAWKVIIKKRHGQYDVDLAFASELGDALSALTRSTGVTDG